MPIHVELREAEQVLYIKFPDIWDTGDLRQAVIAVQNHLRSVSQPVQLIVDARAIFQVPLGTLSLIPIRRPSLAMTRVSECIFIGGTSVTRNIAQAAFKLCNLRQFTFVESEEQVRKHRQSEVQSELPA